MITHKSRRSVRPIHDSLQEYGRGMVGGMLFSLPMLYTMEVWWTGFLVEPRSLLIYLGTTFLLLLGYNRYAGLRRDASFTEVIIDSVEEMGLGLLISAGVLFLLGRLQPEMPFSEIAGMIIVEAMTVAVGVSVGTAQLGAGGQSDTGVSQSTSRRQEPKQPDTLGQLVLAFCGAILLAANVAPTEEILMIGIETSTPRLMGLVALSLVTGAVILFYSGFSGSDRHVRADGAFWTTYSVITSYAAALMASALMLWFFGRLEGVSLTIAVSQIVVLAFPAMLGASAGRLLIQ